MNLEYEDEFGYVPDIFSKLFERETLFDERWSFISTPSSRSSLLFQEKRNQIEVLRGRNR